MSSDEWCERNNAGQWIKVNCNMEHLNKLGVKSLNSASDLNWASGDTGKVGVGIRRRTNFQTSPLGVDQLLDTRRLQYTVTKTKSPFGQFLSALLPLLFIGATYSTLQYFQLAILQHLATLLFLSLLAITYLRSLVTQETLLAVGSLGLQLSQNNAFGRSCSTRFVPHSEIKAIVVNETIKRHRVISYLAVILRVPDANNRLILPIFHETLPRLATLEKVYYDLQKTLFS